MSGHSKWANIKHRKGRQDAKRGKVFTRIAKEITISAREGGGDVDANSRLRLAITSARAVNMPADNITRAIKKGTGELAGESYEEINYEGYLPSGVAAILECVTDNRNRTFPEIRTLFNKFGGNLGEPNSVAWNFTRNGVFTIKNNGKTEDELLEIVLESGAEDLEYGDEESRIICAMESFNILNKYLNENKFEITEGKLEQIAQNMVSITDINDARKVLRAIEMIEDNDDVQNCYSNFDISEEIMAQLENE